MRIRFAWPGSCGLALAVASTLAGCSDAGRDVGDGAASSELASTTTDSAGVEVVVTTPVDPPPSSGWTIGPEPEVVFGAGGPDPVEWFRIDDAMRLPDGRVAALDAGTKRLFLFAPDGELLATAGREGDGPGEFQRPAGMALLGPDTIAVLDHRHRRLALFDEEASWIEDRSLDTEENFTGASYRLADAADGELTLISYSFRIEVRAGVPESDRTIDNPQLRYAADGSFVGEVGEPNSLWLYASGTELDARLFGGNRGAAAGGGRVYVRDPAGYELRVYGPEGDLERIHRLERARRPVGDGDVDRYREFRSNQIEDDRMRSRTLERLERQTVADSFPSIRSAVIDTRGDIWVTEYAPPWVDDRTTAVFAADGPWLGTVELPVDFRPLEIGGDYVLGVLTDELDVERLVTYGLDR